MLTLNIVVEYCWCSIECDCVVDCRNSIDKTRTTKKDESNIRRSIISVINRYFATQFLVVEVDHKTWEKVERTIRLMTREKTSSNRIDEREETFILRNKSTRSTISSRYQTYHDKGIKVFIITVFNSTKFILKLLRILFEFNCWFVHRFEHDVMTIQVCVRICLHANETMCTINKGVRRTTIVRWHRSFVSSMNPSSRSDE
jgi:hypothetical protein